MGNLEELVQKAEIKFPRTIELGEVKILMMILAEKLPASIDYYYTIFGEIHGLEKKPDELRPREYDSQFEGNIVVTNPEILEPAPFKLKRGPVTEGLRYGSLNFQLIAGKRPEEYAKLVGVWGNARVLIEEYFFRENSPDALRR